MVTGNPELPNINAGNRTWILYIGDTSSNYRAISPVLGWFSCLNKWCSFTRNSGRGLEYFFSSLGGELQLFLRRYIICYISYQILGISLIQREIASKLIMLGRTHWLGLYCWNEGELLNTISDSLAKNKRQWHMYRPVGCSVWFERYYS